MPKPNQIISKIIAERNGLKKHLADAPEKIAGLERALSVITQERDELKGYLAGFKNEIQALSQYKTWAPPGHFYSPIPCIDEIKPYEDKLFSYENRCFLGIDLNETEQIELVNQFSEYYKSIPFGKEEDLAYRYYFNNPFFSYSDGIALYCMINQFKPNRIIEIGSGFSSALMMDTNEHCFNNQISITFIEPFPERLNSLRKPQDDIYTYTYQKLQDVGLDVFSSLRAGDILFIDSTHVAKIGSDVNYYMFEILPRLHKGVLVHVHDISYPFEYTKDWIYEGRAWNEQYMLRAFLQFNNTFKIKYWGSYLGTVHEKFLFEHLPLCAENLGGSIWLEKTV